MEAIYKYPIDITDEENVLLPIGAKPLCVQIQNNQVYLWAIVKIEQVLEERIIYVYSTGHHHENILDKEYIGTVQFENRGLVFHVFINKI